MALAIVARNGRSGQLIVKDTRSDGAVVLFVCDPFDGSAAAFFDAKSKDGGRGPIPDPDADRVLRSLEFTDADTFVFTLDTSGLPRGRQMVQSDVFLSRMMRALEEGVSTVELSSDIASDWGFVSEDL